MSFPALLQSYYSFYTIDIGFAICFHCNSKPKPWQYIVCRMAMDCRKHFCVSLLHVMNVTEDDVFQEDSQKQPNFWFDLTGHFQIRRKVDTCSEQAVS